jgi:hypothetical protein
METPEQYAFRDTESPHFASRARCLNCLAVWASVYPEEANEHTLECPRCGACMSTIIQRLLPEGGTEFLRQGECN